MKKRILSLSSFLALLFVAVCVRVAAQETPPAASQTDSEHQWFDVHVALQASYLYNVRSPSSSENELRVFDYRSNSFTLDLAQLVVGREAPVGSIGYKVKLSAGKTAQFIHSLGLGIDEDEDPLETDPFDLTEAYVDYVAPIGRGITIRFGKFVTAHGAEVIEAKDNQNYSRSLLFNYAIPFTHTGIVLGYSFSEAIAAQVHVVNGWDTVVDNNSSKSVGLSLHLTPTDDLSCLFNLMYGPERKDNNSDNRFLFDWVFSLRPHRSTELLFNVDYGFDEHGAPDTGIARWYGVSGAARYRITDWLSMSVRLEYVRDDDGARTGYVQDVKEVTYTPEVRIAQSLILRPEYRHDWSNARIFDQGRKKSQDTLALAALYSW